jgi:hopanoid biosynthesis associated RND transporter like protein HpnN
VNNQSQLIVNKEEQPSSLMARILGGVTNFCVSFPRWTLFLVALSVAASFAYSSLYLKFKTDRSDLIDPKMDFHQRWLKYTKSFGDTNEMVVAVEANDPEIIQRALDALGTKLATHPELFSNILYKIEPGKLQEKGLQYLPARTLVEGLERLEDYSPILKGRWDLVKLSGVLTRLRTQLGHTPPGQAERLWDHAGLLTESLSRFLENKDDFTNPWPQILQVDPQQSEQANQTIYLLNEGGTMGFLMTAANPQTNEGFEGATHAIDTLRQLITQTQLQVPKARILLTGIPVLENDEMRRSQIDSTHASFIAFFGVALIFFIGLRGFLHPLMGMIMLAVGMTWSFGVATLLVGHLNILSVSFASIVIGLGNDFAIHILSRYLDLRHHGRDLRSAMIETSQTLGPGIVTGSVTTALAFYCAGLTTFLGVAELGLIAGSGILLCTLATFTCLPAMVAVADRNSREQALPVPFQGKLLRRITSGFPRTVLVLSVVLLGVVAWKSFDWSGPIELGKWPKPLLQYDHNLLHLQADGLESVDAQKKIFEASRNSLLFAVSVADSPEQARTRKAEFEALPSVHHVEDLASRLPTVLPAENRLLVQGFHSLLSGLPEAPPNPPLTGPADIGLRLEELYRFAQSRPEAQAKGIVNRLDRFLDKFADLDVRQQVSLMMEFEYRLRYSLLAQFQAIHAASDPTPISAEDLPAALRSRYISPDGKWLLQVFPKSSIWDMEPLEQFVKDLRSVDADVTGVPLQNFEAARQIKQSYEICSIYSLIVILAVLLIDFLRKEVLVQSFLPSVATIAMMVAFCVSQKTPLPILPLAIIGVAMAFAVGFYFDRAGVLDTISAIIPPTIGMLLMFGILTICNIPLNPANLIILPLIIGIGVDNGVHVLHDFHSKPNEVYSASPSLVNAITLTQSTSIVGFGSMMISAHRGLRSLGIVLTIGVATCVLMSLVTLPAFLAWISHQRGAKEAQPVPADLGPNLDSGAASLQNEPTQAA